MNKTTHTILRAAGAAAFLTAAACGSDSGKADAPPTVDSHHVDGPAIDSPMGSNGSGSATFRQIEQLARPGINEALLISNDFLNGYNAAAPTFAGVDPTTLAAVVGEAKTVLKAIYLGTCLLDGVAAGGSLTPATGLKPGGQTCVAIGPAIFQADGVTLTAAAGSAAQAYADAQFGLFIPDVMRTDTSLATSGYLNACGAGSGAPLLCGGRFIDDDVIDVTYYYLIGGLDNRITLGSAATYNQFSALVSDGVAYSSDNSLNKLNTTPSDPTNTNQFHPAANVNFPYSAPPF
jgi:hypothetical protein